MRYEYRDIVLGSSLDAVIFAFSNKYPLFFSEEQRPFRFDYLEPELDFSFLKLANNSLKSLATFDGDKRIGLPKELLWERLLFLMSIHGYAPTANLCTNIRRDSQKITCFNEYSKIAEVGYDRIHDFTVNDKRNKVIFYDWIAFNSGGKHDIDFIKTGDDFVDDIWFYPSDRICGKTKVKDACAVSYVDKELINEFDYSQTMARFKVVKEMESRGMKGLLSSYGPNGKPKHYNFKTSTMHRQKGIDSCEVTERQLLQLKRGSLPYQKYLRYL